MSEKLPPPERTSHPFYMHDMIKDIPGSIKSTIETVRSNNIETDSQGPVVFTGNGTAFYSALMGSQILKFTKAQWKAVQAFELTNYETAPKGVVIGVSHSGITKSTLDALSRAKSTAARVIGVTHFEGRPISKIADKTLVIGNGPDKSTCHTKTYAASASACMEISFRLADSLGNELDSVKKQFHSELLTKLESVITSSENTAKKAVEEMGSASKIFFTGAGPNLVTAREAALKIKESSYLTAEGMELEELQHGPWSAFDAETLVVVISPSGPSQQRAKDLLSASKKIGAKTIFVSDSQGSEADLAIKVPTIHEYLSPFLMIIPLYFFSYFLSVKKGNNPDYLHYLDNRYWNARQTIFPPGTH